jgi:hypothetical protein
VNPGDVIVATDVWRIGSEPTLTQSITRANKSICTFVGEPLLVLDVSHLRVVSVILSDGNIGWLLRQHVRNSTR